MTATTAFPLPLGPLDPERSELLRRVVDGLEPVSLHWLSGFTAGVAYARGHGGVEQNGRTTDTSRLAGRLDRTQT